MSDLLKASDFGISTHITAQIDFHKSYPSTLFYKISDRDILQKITALSCELSERDFELAITKPLLPIGFKIKPDVSIQKTNSSPTLSSTASIYQNSSKNILSAENNAFQMPSPQDDTEFLAKKILEAETLAQQASDLVTLKSAINNFDSMLESQKFALKTLFYDDSDTVDILWISDSVSYDDDKKHRIMSDTAGDMIVNLFNSLGYGRSKPHINGQIGFAALSFWAISDTQNAKEYQLCLPFIKRLIYLLNPRKIILSGNMPLHYLLNKQDIFEYHGQKFSLQIDDKNFKSYSVFNPSYILCSDTIKKLFWFDLLKILHDTD